MTALQRIKYVLLTGCIWLLVQSSECTTDVSVDSLLPPNYNRSDYIPFDKWHCGAGDFDKHLSHQLSQIECPARMYEANLCCLAHDLCYMEEDKTQEYCDSTFCFCLNRTLSMPNSNYSLGCTNVAEGFCDIVQIFGAAAHSSAKKGSTTKAASTTTGTALSTTTTPATASPSTTLTTSAPSPADIMQFVIHNISLHCYNHELGNCLEELHKCVATYSQLLAEDLSSQPRTEILYLWTDCFQQFCECAKAKTLLNKRGQQQDNHQCSDGIKMICKQMPTKLIDPMHVNIQLWTTNVNYLEGTASSNSVIALLLLAIVTVLTLVVFVCLCYKFYINYKAHRSEGSGISGAAEFVRARRLTLRKEENKEPGYKCLQDKCSTERLHTFDHLLPMNSSKAQLIAEDNNSSSTPSIDSAA